MTHSFLYSLLSPYALTLQGKVHLILYIPVCTLLADPLLALQYIYPSLLSIQHPN